MLCKKSGIKTIKVICKNPDDATVLTHAQNV